MLSLAHIRKSFGEVLVIENVGFNVAAGEVVGLVGENGAGKSTTMNIIAGILGPDAGTMRLGGAPFAPTSRAAAEASGIGFIQQELNIFPNLSVAENLFLGRAPRWQKLPIFDVRCRDREACHWMRRVGLSVSPDAPASTLAAGERQLLEIARALSSDARLLIFDEPTTSLTTHDIDRLKTLICELRAEGIAILFVSHALEDVLELADRIVVLRDGQVTLDAPRDNLEVPDLVGAMIGRAMGDLYPKRPPLAPGAAQPLLRVEGLGAEGQLADIAFILRPGEILGIGGLMGAGRTELARIIFGIEEHDTGRICVDDMELASGDRSARRHARVALLTEDRRHEGMLGGASVTDNIGLAALSDFRRGIGIDRASLAEAALNLAARLRLKSGPLASTPIARLSGGNQQKALLARLMLTTPRVLILDEPTRGVDIAAKQEIYTQIAALAAAGAGVLLISSELEELMGLADRIIMLHKGRLAGNFLRRDFDRTALLAAAFGQRLAA